MHATAAAHVDVLTQLVRDEITRAADWSRATVAVVNGDGTVDLLSADGSTVPHVRCASSYSRPIVGDVVVAHRAGDGNRYVAGPLSTGATGWTTLPLVSGFTANGNSNGTPTYRVVSRSGTPYLELAGGVGVTTDPGTGSPTFANLPAAVRPLTHQSVPVAKSLSAGIGTTKVDINADGTCVLFGTGGASSTISWISLNGVSVRLDAY